VARPEYLLALLDRDPRTVVGDVEPAVVSFGSTHGIVSPFAAPAVR
jgi:hypothetical protein